MALPSRPPSSTLSRSSPPPPASGGGGGEALRRCNRCCHCRHPHTLPLSLPGHLILSQFLLCPVLFCTQKQVTVANAYATGQKVMGRANLRLGKLLPGSPEDLHFRAFFGVSAQVSVTAWDMMENHSVLPPTPEFLHFYGRSHSCAHILQTTPLSQVC